MQRSKQTLIKNTASIQDWTAVAQNAVGVSAIYDCSNMKEGILHIQAALTTTTAHANGTKFTVQISSDASSNENWQEFVSFIALVGTAATDLIENDPLAAGSTSITFTAHALTTLAKYLYIKDSTLINSELVFESASSTNAITITDGTTNAHAVNTAIYNIAMTQNITIPSSVYRLRVLVDNTVVSAGSTLDYNVRISVVT